MGPTFKEFAVWIKGVVQYTINYFLVCSMVLQIGITKVCFQSPVVKVNNSAGGERESRIRLHRRPDTASGF